MPTYRIALLACCIAPLVAASGSPAEPERYTVILGGNVAGAMTSTAPDPLRRVFTFEFNDRGRGPKLRQEVTLDRNGLPLRVAITGNDYLKSEVNETFSVGDGVARWNSKAENGSVAFGGNAFFLSMNGAPAETALLASALLRAPDRTLDLLPAGSATLERIGKHTFDVAGVNTEATLYEISGVAFAPIPVWLRDGGRMFATTSEWLSVVPEGAESAVGEMIAAQKRAQTERSKRMALDLGRRPAGGIAFTGARVFDADSGAIHENMTVLVRGNIIAAVGADGTIVPPPGAVTIDSRGKTLLPGLWDMHAHLSPLDGPLNVAAGVTSVRDLANDIDAVSALRSEFDSGDAIGPRVVLAGFMDGPGPFAGPTKVLVDSEAEIKAAVERYAKLGYEQIKMYSSIKTELVPVIIEHAHRLGLRVSGHIPAFMLAEQAVRLGFDEIQHANMLFLNFYPDIGDTRTPARFTTVAERGADLDLDSERVRAFVDLLRVRRVTVDPTLTIFEMLMTARPGSISPGFVEVAGRLPPQVRRGFLGGGLPVPDGMDGRYRASFRRMLDLVAMLHRAGVEIVAGTDAMAGFALHRELELYVEAGIPPADVLRIATLGAARVTGRDNRLGSITPGKLADLVLVDGDPLADISDVRRVGSVVKDGVLYDSRDILRALGVR